MARTFPFGRIVAPISIRGCDMAGPPPHAGVAAERSISSVVCGRRISAAQNQNFRRIIICRGEGQKHRRAVGSIASVCCRCNIVTILLSQGQKVGRSLKSLNKKLCRWEEDASSDTAAESTPLELAYSNLRPVCRFQLSCSSRRSRRVQRKSLPARRRVRSASGTSVREPWAARS